MKNDFSLPFWQVPAPAESTAKPQVGSDRDLNSVKLEMVVFFVLGFSKMWR